MALSHFLFYDLSHPFSLSPRLSVSLSLSLSPISTPRWPLALFPWPRSKKKKKQNKNLLALDLLSSLNSTHWPGNQRCLLVVYPNCHKKTKQNSQMYPMHRSEDHGTHSSNSYIYITAPVSIAQETWLKRRTKHCKKQNTRISAVQQSLLEITI